MVPTYLTLLATCQSVFNQTRTFRLFRQLVDAWLLCTTRRTITGVLAFIPGAERRVHDAYHHFFQCAHWDPDELFDLLTCRLVRALCPSGVVTLDLDDTLHHKAGRKVAGCGIWRDAVRSTARQTVYALGLNLIVLTVRITPPWGGFPIAVPVRVRVHRKGAQTYFELAEAMIRDLAVLLPGCQLRVCADGFYAPLATQLPPEITLTSRLRRDASLHDHPCPRPAGTRGRKPTKGPALAKPPALAEEAAALGLFNLTTVPRGQQTVERLVYSRTALWNGVTILIVLVRDPDGHEDDDDFFTTDLTACALDVPDHYGGRWAIELTFRDVKQHLGGQEPQCWADRGPERAAAFAYWLYALVWYGFLTADSTEHRRRCSRHPGIPRKPPRPFSMRSPGCDGTCGGHEFPPERSPSPLWEKFPATWTCSSSIVPAPRERRGAE